MLIKKYSEFISEHLIEESANYEYKINTWKNNTSNILFICGLSGSGKTTLGKEIAKLNNANYN